MSSNGFAADPLRALNREMQVKSGKVPEYLDQPDFDDGDGFQIRDSMFRAETANGVMFLYRKGEGLTVDLPNPALQDEFNMYLVGAVLGTVSWMNGLLPLHASAVVKDGRTVAFTADSGGGKSTLAASLAERGYRHLCDDTLVLQCSDSQVLALPDGKPRKLWGDAVEHLGVAPKREIAFVPGKFYVDPTDSVTDPVPLTDLVFLEFGDDVSLEPIVGADKMRYASGALYFAFVQRAVNSPIENAKLLTQLARNVRFWKGTRPRNMEFTHAFSDILEQATTAPV